MNTHIGIDPGTNGAVAVMWPSGEITIYDLTGNPHDDASVFLSIVSVNGGAAGLQVTLERTCGMPADDGKGGRRGMGATSAYNFGKVCGQIEGILAALSIPYALVTPVKWRNAIFDGGSKGLTQPERKKASLALAKRLYPQVAHQLTRVKDADRAEAVLMARYGQRN